MKYFAYGSNMNPNRMKEREISFTERKHAILKRWRLKFNKLASGKYNEGYANIEKDNGSVVEGILYTRKDKDIKKLDKYEGYPNHYKKQKERVKSENFEEVEAITYVATTDKVEEGLKPSKSYLNHLLKGCDLLSKKYCEKLEKWKTLN